MAYFIGSFFIVSIFALIFLYVKLYKNLPNKEEKNKMVFPLVIGFISCMLMLLIGAGLPKGEIGKYQTGCIFAHKKH